MSTGLRASKEPNGSDQLIESHLLALSVRLAKPHMKVVTADQVGLEEDGISLAPCSDSTRTASSGAWWSV